MKTYIIELPNDLNDGYVLKVTISSKDEQKQFESLEIECLQQYIWLVQHRIIPSLKIETIKKEDL